MRVTKLPQWEHLDSPSAPIACTSQRLRSPSVADQIQQRSLQQLYQKKRPGHLQKRHLWGE